MLKTSFLAFLCSCLAVASNSVCAEGPRTIVANAVTLIVTEEGEVYASGNAQPCRGDDEEGARNLFQPIPLLKSIREIDIFSDASGDAAALDQNGFVWVWGEHWRETVFPGGGELAHIPFKHPGLKDIKSIAMGEDHMVVLERSGTVVTVPVNDSANLYGMLGNGRIGSGSSGKPDVHQLAEVKDAIAVEASPTATFVLRADGTVWGCGYRPMLGIPTSMAGFDATEPEKMCAAKLMKIDGLRNIKELSAGLNFALALDANNQVWGWGLNDSAQLGPGATDLMSIAPRKLRGLNKVVAISAGRDFLLAVTKSGQVIAQGCNVHGTLGDDGDELEGKQRAIAALKSVKHVFAGEFNAFAQVNDGSLFGWGNNAPDAGGFAATKDPLRLGVTEFKVKAEGP